MADDLKVKDSPGGLVAGGTPEPTPSSSPQEQKFEAWVSRERVRGNTAPLASLRRTFQGRVARSARTEGNIQSSRAHYQSQENEAVEETGSSGRESAATLIGSQTEVSGVSGLSEEQEREVAGGSLGTSPMLPPVDSPQITSDQAYEFLGTTFARHRERNGESLDLDAILREVDAKSTAPGSRPSGGGVRSGSGASALSMRIGAGGANLAPASGGSSDSTSSSSENRKYSTATAGSRYNWPNFERELVLFMLREAKDNPKLRRLLKGLRTESAKSSLGGRELDKLVTEIRQFNQKMRMAQSAMQAGERVSQGIAQGRADGVTGKIEDEDPTQSVTAKEAHPRRLRERMAEIVDKVEKQTPPEGKIQDPEDTAHLKEVPRGMLTADELEDLKEKHPELHKEYADAFQEYRNFHPSVALASLKQNQALLPEDQRAGFDEAIADVEALVTERSRGAFSDQRGYGMLEFNRSQLYKQVKDINRQLVELKGLRGQITDLKAEGGSDEAVGKLQARLDAKEGGMNIRELHKRKLLLLESIVETDNRLSAHRPLTPEMIESQEKNHEAQKKGIDERVPALKEEIKKAEAEYKEKPTEKAYAVLVAKRFELHEVESTNDKVIDYMDKLYDAMKHRRMPGDMDGLESTSDDGEGIYITEQDDLPSDLDKRMADLETRARAGEEFHKEKSGMFDIRGERARDISIGQLDRTLDKLANPWSGALARAVGGTIGDAKANAKQAGGAIRAVENVQDMTSRLLRLADQARKMRG